MVLGGVGPLPVEVNADPLSGQPATGATWQAMGEHAAGQIDPPDDAHGDTAGDTAAQPFGAGSWASRSTVVGGSAVHQAALAVRERALQLAARVLEAAEQDLDLADGSVSVRGDPDAKTARLSLADIAKAAVSASRYLQKGEPAGLSARRRFEVSHMTYPYGVHAAVVEVDAGTGQVRVLRYLVAYEVGRAMGAGEGGINAVGATVANAVRDALGLVGGLGQLPLTPARVCALAALAQPTGGPVTGGRA